MYPHLPKIRANSFGNTREKLEQTLRGHPPQVLRVRALRRDRLMADGVPVLVELGRPRRPVRRPRGLPYEGRALEHGGGGALVLHPLREHAHQSLHAAAARRAERGRAHAQEPLQRAAHQQLPLRRQQAPDQVPGHQDQHQHDRETHLRAGHASRLQASAQAVRARREEPLSPWTVSFPENLGLWDAGPNRETLFNTV